MPALVDATPYWMAARFTQPAVMRLLAKHGADPKVIHESKYVQGEGYQRRAERTTAIMAALGMGGGTAWVPIDRAERDALILETVKVAVELGADVNAASTDGRTALDSARAQKYDAVARFLEERGHRRIVSLALIRLRFHRHAEPLHRPVHRHPRSIDRIEPEVLRDFRRGPLRLDARDDELALSRIETAHRRAIARVRLFVNGLFLRRGCFRREIIGKLDRDRAARKAAHLVANPVDDRLSKVGLHRADMPRLERVEPRDRIHRGVLNEIARIEMAARRGRQPPMRPAFQGRKAALKDRFDRRLIAGARTYDELNRGFVA